MDLTMTFLRSLVMHAIHDSAPLRRRLATAAVSGLERATEAIAAWAGVPAALESVRGALEAERDRYRTNVNALHASRERAMHAAIEARRERDEARRERDWLMEEVARLNATTTETVETAD